jgi:beta-glucosidase
MSRLTVHRVLRRAPLLQRRALVQRFGVVAIAALVLACGNSNATPTPGSSGTSKASVPAPSGSAAVSKSPWLDATKTVDQRVSLLLAQMTLDEKIGQMTQIEIGALQRDPTPVATAFMGSVLSGGDANPSGTNDATNWYSMVGGMQSQALSTRLAIPMLYGVDAVHGDAHVGGTTVFPHNVGMGATHDAALVQQECKVTAAEMNATGVRWTFGPVVAVPQDIRWGRTYEGYGENTELVTQLGTACLKGFQGTSLTDPNTVVADPKHFLGDGGTAAGTGQQSILDRGTDNMTSAQIETQFLPPYTDAVKNGARIIMVTFSGTQEGGKVTGDKHWLTDVLKTQLGFTGFLVSDWGAIDLIDTTDYTASVKQAINAGIDMAMVPDDWAKFQSTLKGLVQSGDVTQVRIDDAVSRILKVKFEMGLFEHPMPPSGQTADVGSAANRAVAAQAVAESAVLLKTSPKVLPIAKTGEKVLIAGQGADDIGLAMGGWSITWQGSAGATTTGTTLVQALQAKLGSSLTYSADAGFDAGTKGDLGIVVVSEPPYAENLGDSPTLELPSTDVDLIAKMKPLVKKLVVVIYSGRPMLLNGIINKADAVVAAWLPGTEVEGLADVLLGDKAFVGTTTYTWPKTADDAARQGKTACQGAVFPYGYGLDATGKLLGPKAC